MPMRDRLARHVHRNPRRPTLRQRAAALKASAAKVMQRKPSPVDALAAAAEPVASQPHDALSNPDAALLRLGHALEAAIVAEREACARADAAIRASGASKREDPQAEAQAEAAGTLAADLARQVAEMPAYTADGLRLKIRALIYYDPHSFKAPPDDPDPHHLLAHSLGLDAGRVTAPAAVDPIFPALEEAQRLGAARGKLLEICGELPDDAPEWEPEHEAHAAWFDHIDNVLMQTVPTTAAGCVALARFVVDFCAEEGISITQGTDAASVDNIGPLQLIAQSPALAGPAAYGGPPADPIFAVLDAARAQEAAPQQAAGNDSNPAGQIAAGALRLFDFAGMSAFEVMTLHNHARTIQHVAHGLLAMPCSRSGASGRPRFNAAGALPDLLAALADSIMDACIARAGEPSDDPEEEEERLCVLAEQVIWNGEPEPIRALARDLNAYADRV